jgi:predicted nucleic acid-binding protein
MPDGILLDTSFLISFADRTRKNHGAALQFFQYFLEDGILMFLSTIAASEFQLRQPVTDLPLDKIVVLPFNLDDAIKAAELDFTRHKAAPGISRNALKDDFKLLGQAKANGIAYLITEDGRSLYKYCEELRAKHALTTRAIKLEDGFDKSHFNPAGQHDFDATLQPPSPVAS